MSQSAATPPGWRAHLISPFLLGGLWAIVKPPGPSTNTAADFQFRTREAGLGSAFPPVLVEIFPGRPLAWHGR